jgi:hypothetical protein
MPPMRAGNPLFHAFERRFNTDLPRHGGTDGAPENLFNLGVVGKARRNQHVMRYNLVEKFPALGVKWVCLRLDGAENGWAWRNRASPCLTDLLIC